MISPPVVFPVFFAVWVALGVGGWIFLATRKGAAEKRRVFRALVFTAGVLFALVLVLAAPWPAALFFLPFVALISWLNLRMTRFCDACGKMMINHQWWTTMNYCSHCGKELSK